MASSVRVENSFPLVERDCVYSLGLWHEFIWQLISPSHSIQFIHSFNRMVDISRLCFQKCYLAGSQKCLNSFQGKNNNLNLFIFFTNLKCKNNCDFHRHSIIFLKIVFVNVHLTSMFLFHLCITTSACWSSSFPSLLWALYLKFS